VAEGIRRCARTARAGHRPDHPLPAPARRAGARPRPHHDRRRIVASGGLELAAARAGRLRGVPERDDDDGTALDVPPHPKRLPHPRLEVDGRPIVYLDSANSSQKPRPSSTR
jgi:hypothetical protein